MAIAYTQKLILSGNFLEHYRYENKIFAGYERRNSGIYAPTKGFLRSDFSVSRTRNNLRRLIESNPYLDKFYTFTFAKNKSCISDANAYFSKFIKRVRYCFCKTLEYISVIEFQKRGAVHYHTLLNLPWLKKTQLIQFKDLWGAGRIHAEPIKDAENVGAYVSKYLEKEGYDKRFYSKKKYFVSRNIKRPIVFKNDFQINDFMAECRKSLELKFACRFNSEYAGRVSYYQYYRKQLFAMVK